MCFVVHMHWGPGVAAAAGGVHVCASKCSSAGYAAPHIDQVPPAEEAVLSEPVLLGTLCTSAVLQ